uniref:Centrosomal protein 63 n=1 Tax=Cynoglossus semilaevis TaxID=244447 RepID=A0A3P8UNN4_CYNSE
MEASLGSLQNPDLSAVLSSCEPELRELMRQIDIMVNHQKKSWEAENHDLRVRLKSGQDDLQATSNIIKRRDLEIGLLHKQLENVQTDQQQLISKYEQQLQKVREELNRLKRSYQKLERKHVKESSRGLKGTDVSEATHLHKKTEEYRQHLTECEQQHVWYQNQMTALEAQNKSLTNELACVKSQMSILQMENEHRECCSEVQSLRTRLERTQGDLHLKELELEKLEMLQMRRGQYQGDQQGLTEKPEELYSMPDTRDTPTQKHEIELQRLQNENARLNQSLRAKDHVIRSLEDCLTAQGCAGLEPFRRDLEKTATQLQSARACEVHLKAEVVNLRERLENLNRQKSDHTNTEQDLRSLRAEYDCGVAEIKKLKEELHRARQSHSDEVDRLRKEVSKMTDELRQRDLTIDSLKGSLSNITQQLRAELEREKQRAAELQVTRTQLEVVKTENHRLKDLLRQPGIRSSKQEDSSGTAMRENHMSSQSSLEQENEMLRQALTAIHAKKSEQTSAQDRIKVMDQKKKQDHVKVLEAKLPDPGPHHEAENQKLFKKQHPLSQSPSEQPCSQTPDNGSPSSSSTSSSSSSSCNN